MPRASKNSGGNPAAAPDKKRGAPRRSHAAAAAMEGRTRVRNGQRSGEESVAPPPLQLDEQGRAVAAHTLTNPEARVYIGDCREIIARVPECRAGTVDLIFADPPFNWKRGYDSWNDDMAEEEYLAFTYEWLDLCIGALRDGGSLWVNIPDDWAAEIVMHLKGRKLTMVNWAIWHYRFGQNTTERFISSKVHVLYFCKGRGVKGTATKIPGRTWNPTDVLELSDRASTYFDPRTLEKNDGMPAGRRVPLDVWYGRHFGRVQGNNAERRNYHDNQLPEAYLNRVVRCASNPGDLVMDPFLGSGTTGVMAHALGRRFIGCEFSPVNAANAIARIKAGPVRTSEGPTSSAIFEPRRVGKKTAARMGGAARSALFDPEIP